ncbi:hypothetical protein SAMN02744124_01335 [Paenibacillus barengoltzii J12]|uniref:Uncharacterized protein n=2 Tax=Paenibacillus barengoltzii TaxID=343517 RepID=R9LHW6_9BACL|nr:hypothetical protein C812_01026 [Paenibacillus barengoltzii G22]SMF11007.1 hypothetical protein SAMN02744124_01335 [Paenibacillus barengoltzii J12]
MKFHIELVKFAGFLRIYLIFHIEFRFGGRGCAPGPDQTEPD